MRRIFLLFLAIGLMTSCSKDSNVETEKENNEIINLSGHVEKGPFVRGATITAYELTKNLTATGKTFKSELINNIGEFSFTNIESSAEYLELTANGYYYNENLGQLSNSTITLNAIISSKSNSNITVNVLTHLEQKRVKYLLKQGTSFTNAKNQARKELFDAFFISGIINDVNSEQITLTKNSKASTALLGISSLLLKLSDNNDAKLTELLSNLSNDLEQDGKLDAETSNKIEFELASLDNTTVNRNIKQRMAESNITLTDFNFAEVFDQTLMNRVQSITTNNKELLLIVSDKAQLGYSIFPVTALVKDVKFISSQPGLVSISSTGEIQALAKGDALITVESSKFSQVKTSVRVRVLDKISLNIKIDNQKSNYTINNGYYNGEVGLSINNNFSDFFNNPDDLKAHDFIFNKVELYSNGNLIKTNNIEQNLNSFTLLTKLENYFRPKIDIHYSFRGKKYIETYSNF